MLLSRAQLDLQSYESEHLSQRLLGGYGYPLTGSLLDKLELPVVAGFSNDQPACGSTTNQQLVYATEQKLRESQNEVLDIRTKLEEVVTISEKQREHFRATVEDLRQQLMATSASKDAVLRAKEIEVVEQESCVSRLRRQVEQLESANKSQEKTLLKMNERLAVQQREQRLVESSLNLIRGQLLDQERKRGVLFCSGANAHAQVSVLDQDITLLVPSIDRCIQELDLDVEVKKEKIKELTYELNFTRDQFAVKKQEAKKRHEAQISEVTHRLNNEISTANDNYVAANKRVAFLEEQLAQLREDYERLIKAQTTSVEETDQRLRLISEERECERKLSAQNKITMEKALDDAQCEIVDIRTDRDIKTREAAAMESRFADLQNVVSGLRTELEERADEIRRLKDRELDLQAQERANELIQKKQEAALNELRSTLETANRLHESQLQELVGRAESDAEHNTVSRMESLSIQVTTLTEKCHRATRDLESMCRQHVSLQERYTELHQAYETTCHQLRLVTESRGQLNSSNSDQMAEVNRLARAAEVTAYELTKLKSQKEKLTIQLEERERNFISLKEQTDLLTSLNNSYVQRELSQSQEKNESERRLLEKLAELDELKTEKQIMLQKISSLEKHARNFEGIEKSLKAELAESKLNLEAAELMKGAASADLRETQFELSSLKGQAASLQRLLEQHEGSLGLELNHVTQKLRDTERELRLSRKALKVHEETDEKAIEVAGKMQKEVTEKRSHIDSLCSKIHWLEDSLDISAKEKKALEEISGRLRGEVDKATEQREKVSSEYRQILARCNHLQLQLMQSETARERASLEQAAAKSQAEQFAQEITCSRFRHQLELKELERKGQIVRSQYAQVPVVMTASGDDASHAFSPPSVAVSYDSTIVAATAPSVSVPSSMRSTTSTGLTREYLTSIKSSLAIPLQHDIGTVGSELHQLLQEMRSVLQVSQNPTSVAATAAAAVYMPSQTMNSRRCNVDHEISSLQETSNFQSSNHSASHMPVSSDTEDWSRDLPVRDRRSSAVLPSVFDLMTSTVHSSTTACRRNFTDSVPNAGIIGGINHRAGRPSVNRNTKRHKAKSQTAPFDPETKAICDRLEKKIESLSRLGCNLQKDNHDQEKSMKGHGKHSSKVRSQLLK